MMARTLVDKLAQELNEMDHPDKRPTPDELTCADGKNEQKDSAHEHRIPKDDHRALRDL